MANSYLISDWVNMVHDKREYLHNQPANSNPQEKYDVLVINGNFEVIVKTILDLTKEYFNYRKQQHLPISFEITCVMEEEDPRLLICDFKIIQQNNHSDTKQFYKCLSHVPMASMNHIFSPGVVWVAAELKQTIRLTLDPSL